MHLVEYRLCGEKVGFRNFWVNEPKLRVFFFVSVQLCVTFKLKLLKGSLVTLQPVVFRTWLIWATYMANISVTENS